MCTTLPSLLVVDHHCVKLTERSNLSRRRRKKTKRYLGISRSTKCFVKLNCLCHSMQNSFGTRLNDNIFKCRKTLREANRVKTYCSIKSDGRTPYINFVVQRRQRYMHHNDLYLKFRKYFFVKSKFKINSKGCKDVRVKNS